MKETEAIAQHLSKSSRRFRLVYKQDPQRVMDLIATARTRAWFEARRINRIVALHGSVGGEAAADSYLSAKPRTHKMVRTIYSRKGEKPIRVKGIIGPIVLGVVIRLIVDFIFEFIQDRYLD